MMKTIQITIDEELLDRLDEVVKATETTRSALTRKLFEAEIRRHYILELERRDREGYEKYPVQPGEFDVSPADLAWGDEWDEKAWSEK